MTLSEETTARLKRAAIAMTGLPAVLSGAGMIATIGGLVILLEAWLQRGHPHMPAWFGILALAVGVSAVIIGGVLHERRYVALARAAGLSDSQAKALSDQADKEQAA